MFHSNLSRILAAGVLLCAASVRADGVAFKHAATIYADEESRPLKLPEGVTCTSAAIVVADSGNGRLVSYVLKDGIPEGGTAVQLDGIAYPTRVQLDGTDRLLVLDRKTKRIGRVALPGRFEGWVEVPGAPAGAIVGAFTLDAARNLYVLEITAGNVVVVGPDGKLVRTIPVPRGAALRDLAVDAAGRLFAVDATGAMVWVCDRADAAFKPFTKPLRDVMSFPAYITAAKGRLYVVDEHGSGIVILGQDGGYLGRRLALGWTEGLVRYPAQLCISEAGDAVLADRQNHRVQVFSMR